MKYRIKFRKPIAAFLLTLIAVQILLPVTAWALTSGPTQPEASSFKQAGVSDMVDLFTGNFSYNLPLLDVDGYPLNLNYQSGSGIDDEASWVGLGWNINVGAVNRQLRGIADDMSGEAFKTEHYTKPKVTVGGRLTAKVEVKGKGALKGVGVNGSFSLGVFSDNYTGIGAELGANAGISYSFANSGALTAGMGLGLMSNTQSGVDVTPSLSLSYNMKVSDNNTVSPGLSASIGYNTRGGLKGLTLGSSFSVSGKTVEAETGKVKNGSANYDLAGSTISFNTDPVQPKIQVPYRSTFGSFSFDIGGAAWLIFGGGGGSGYKSVREVKTRQMSNPAFGFLYAERGKKQPLAMMDFLREKESIIIPELPNLAVPVATPDLFSYTSQGGSGQFRLYRGGTGVLFDNQAIDESSTQTLGFDAGIGAYAHGGVTYYEQSVKNATQKWTKNNQYLANGDFQDPAITNPNKEHVFFKQVGERNLEDKVLVDKLQGTQPVAVNISGKTAQSAFRISGLNTTTSVSSIQKTSKERKRTSISFLTAAEASKAGLYKKIYSYPFLQPGSFAPVGCHQVQAADSFIRANSGEGNNIYRRENHISEITVTDEGGKRSVYGIPVYNTKQTEYSFAIGKPGSYEARDATKNISSFRTSGSTIDQARSEDNDHYLHKEEQPGYATNYLLTSILSPDYVDVTNNGITDDDQGTAIKFNYSKLPGVFGWRSPYEDKKATINKGLMADPDDDKASFVYGEKELWYLQSIETKTKIAYFLTEDRKDAIGVANEWGLKPGNDEAKKQKVLKEIRLYSKADLTRPIKIVKLEYGYELCKGVPNFLNDPNETRKGKLTLKKVYFQYGNSAKGQAHPYIFHYNGSGDPDQPYPIDPAYDLLLTDRWGTYKSRQSNSDRGFPLGNDEFPYSTQNKQDADTWAGLWQLSRIEMPTGGEINVTYESDDYAYVQNKQAMVMTKPDNLITEAGTSTTSLSQARGIQLTLPEGKTAQEASEADPAWFKRKYNNGSQYLYTKLFVNLGGLDAMRNPTNEAYYDFVPCYAKINNVVISGTTARIWFETVNEGGATFINPIQLAAWQRLRMEYPRYAYPGYKNRIKAGDAGKAIKAAVTAIVNAAGNLDELRRGFNERAKASGFCNNISLDKSFVRISDVDGVKLGGGSRVKKISISDKWAEMSGNNTITANYGQEYKYTTKVGDKEISTGVASFEPSVGGDENPIRQPIPYVQKIRGAINNFFNLEEPFGESFYPGASVGYSKVTVRDLDATGNPDPQQKTGYIVNEFFTAREFPVIVRSLPNKIQQRGPSGWYSFFGSSSIHELTFSQGYSIELNDMHGKPKATRVYNQTNAEISSTVYHYNAEPLNAGEMKLKNVVTIVNEQGQIEENQIIGREIEVFTDMREQETSSTGENITLGADVFPTPFFGAPGVLPHWPIKVNDEYKLFRSTSTMKVIQYYGIIDKVVKTENGSTITAENVAYDGLTGEVVISSTQNEFEQPIYTVNFPAYWIHPSMSGAYKNIGTIMTVTTNSSGEPFPATNASFLYPGDELINLVNGTRYWVIQTSGNGDPNLPVTKKIVDAGGKAVSLGLTIMKVIRSGYRNLLTPSATSIVCMSNPISSSPDPGTGKKYVVFASDADRTAWKVLTASANVFDETWGAKPDCATCPPGSEMSADKQTCELNVLENTTECFNWCAGAIDANYGSYGANILGEGNDIVLRSSDFWGGACNCQSLAGASTTQVVKYDTAAAKKAKAEKNKQAQTKAQALAVSPACTRSFIPNYVCGAQCGRLNRTGIWLCTGITGNGDYLPTHEWIGFEACVDLPETKTYYIGYAGDDIFRIYIDGALWQSQTNLLPGNWSYWRVRPYSNQIAGKHRIRVEVNNSDVGNASIGLEIYNKTYNELIDPSFSIDLTDPALIFSTARDVPNKRIQTYRHIGEANSTARYTLANGSLPDVCTLSQPVSRVVNPYTKGFLGNWRPKESKVFQVNRKYNDLFNSEPKGVDVKNAGTYEFFRPYWVYKNAQWKGLSGTKEWVTANTMTLYDKYGQELENKDALGRYSAAGFVFRGDLPGAVASNTRNREIYYESFEDYRLREGCITANPNDICDVPVLKPNLGGDILSHTNTANPHSGNYSLALPSSGVTFTTTVHSYETKQRNYIPVNSKGEYTTQLGSGIYPVGFEPMPGKKYVFSAWVKDGQHTSNTPGIIVTINGGSITLTRKAVVEKWKQVEGIIDLTSYPAENPIDIVVQPSGGTVYLDDMRIHPFDSHMKTYAYDDKTLRLMAEMDENNFATFYEYDDEGSLVRLKKETEKGIMTIKENRSSYRKKAF